MRYVRAFGRFWWDFVVGDDWRVAVGIALARNAPATMRAVLVLMRAW